MQLFAVGRIISWATVHPDLRSEQETMGGLSFLEHGGDRCGGFAAHEVRVDYSCYLLPEEMDLSEGRGACYPGGDRLFRVGSGCVLRRQ